MEADQTIKELLKIEAKLQSKEALDTIHARRQKLANIFFGKSKPVDARNACYDELAAIHKYFGFNDIFKVKKAKAGNYQKPVRTAEQRKTDAVTMMKDLWPEAVAYAADVIPVKEKGQPHQDGPMVVDVNQKQRDILAQVFFYGMIESYKQ